MAKIVALLGFVVFSLVFMCFFVPFFFLWIVLLVGPLYHLCWRRPGERRLLANPPIADLYYLDGPLGKVAYRWSQRPGQQSKYPPVVIANGLGATLTMIAPIYDGLVQAGFDVLVHDGNGAGFSAPRTKPVSARQLMAEMKAVMDHVQPKAQWIVVGISMGGITGQLMVALYPEPFAGYVNVDGVPAPLGAIAKTRMLQAGKLYRTYGPVSRTGIFRPMFYWFVRRKVGKLWAHCSVPLDVLMAQLNDRIIFDTVANDSPVMMEICDLALAEWGKPPLLDSPQFPAMVIAPPEHVRTWSSPTPPQPDKEALKAGVRNRSFDTPLLKKWQDLVVRVLSARNYNYIGGSAFLTQEIKDLYAAEHTFLCLYSKNGKRLVLPDHSHIQMAGEVDLIVAAVQDTVASI